MTTDNLATVRGVYMFKCCFIMVRAIYPDYGQPEITTLETRGTSAKLPVLSTTFSCGAQELSEPVIGMVDMEPVPASATVGASRHFKTF